MTFSRLSAPREHALSAGSGGVDHPPLGENGNGGGNAGLAAAADVPVQGDAGDSRPAAAGANNAGSGGVERTLAENEVTEAPLRAVGALDDSSLDLSKVLSGCAMYTYGQPSSNVIGKFLDWGLNHPGDHVQYRNSL